MPGRLSFLKRERTSCGIHCYCCKDSDDDNRHAQVPGVVDYEKDKVCVPGNPGDVFEACGALRNKDARPAPTGSATGARDRLLEET